MHLTPCKVRVPRASHTQQVPHACRMQCTYGWVKTPHGAQQISGPARGTHTPRATLTRTRHCHACASCRALPCVCSTHTHTCRVMPSPALTLSASKSSLLLRVPDPSSSTSSNLRHQVESGRGHSGDVARRGSINPRSSHSLHVRICARGVRCRRRRQDRQTEGRAPLGNEALDCRMQLIHSSDHAVRVQPAADVGRLAAACGLGLQTERSVPCVVAGGTLQECSGPFRNSHRVRIEDGSY